LLEIMKGTTKVCKSDSTRDFFKNNCFTMKEKFRALGHLANRKLICLINFCSLCLILGIICEPLYQPHLYCSLLSYGCKIYFLLSNLIKASKETKATIYFLRDHSKCPLGIFKNKLIFFLAAHQGT
jgi:hypothetical protein